MYKKILISLSLLTFNLLNAIDIEKDNKVVSTEEVKKEIIVKKDIAPIKEVKKEIIVKKDIAPIKEVKKEIIVKKDIAPIKEVKKEIIVKKDIAPIKEVRKEAIVKKDIAPIKEVKKEAIVKKDITPIKEVKKEAILPNAKFETEYNIDTVIPKKNKYSNFDTRIEKKEMNRNSKPIEILKEEHYKRFSTDDIGKISFNANVARISARKYEELVKRLDKITAPSNLETYVTKTYYGNVFEVKNEVISEKIDFGGYIKDIYVKKGHAVFEGEKVIKFKSSSLLLLTTKYLRIKQKVKENIKTLANIKELPVKNHFVDLDDKNKEVNKWLGIIQDTKKEINEMNLRLLNFGIKPSELEEATDTYFYSIQNKGIIKNILVVKDSDVKDKQTVMVIEQKNKYFVKTHIPSKYIKSINKMTNASVYFYGKQVPFKVYKILENDFNVENDSIGVILYSINPDVKFYLNNLVAVEVEVF
jgi:hypothetical protein